MPDSSDRFYSFPPPENPGRLVLQESSGNQVSVARSRQVSWQDIQDIGINAHAYNYRRVNEPILNKISPVPDQIMLSGFVIGSWGILKWGNEFGMPPQALVDYLKARRATVCSGTKAA